MIQYEGSEKLKRKTKEKDRLQPKASLGRILNLLHVREYIINTQKGKYCISAKTLLSDTLKKENLMCITTAKSLASCQAN